MSVYSTMTLSILIVFVNLVIWRRCSLGINVYSVYVTAWVSLVFLGIVTWPIYQEMAREVFSSFYFLSIDASDYARACLVAVLGFSVTNLTYHMGLGFCQLGYGFKRSDLDVVSGRWIHKEQRLRLLILLPLILATVVLILPYTSNFWGLLGSDVGHLLESRREATENYLLLLVVYNLLPQMFWAWLILRADSRPRYPLVGRLFTLLLFLFICVALLSTYQKRPLVVFLLVTIFILFVASQLKAARGGGGRRASWLQQGAVMKSLRSRAPWYISLVFALLMALYALHTNVIGVSGSGLEAFKQLVEIVWTRILGRLSIPSLFYVDYFPSIEGFYGLSNVGMLMNLLGQAPYADTALVFDHYSMVAIPGSLAISATFDFYGQGGIPVVIFGSFILGFVLLLVDVMVTLGSRTKGKLMLFILFAVWAFYLTQASVFRASMGYGLIPGLFIYLVVFFMPWGSRKSLADNGWND